MPDKAREMIITASLPYANGPLHLGHLLEYSQADIWHRFQKMLGNKPQFICGSDAHGTPIMLGAEKNNLPPEDYVAQIQQQHAQDFKDALVEFDIFYTTESEEEQQTVTDIFPKLQQKGDISEREIEQAYDNEAKMFLPDRYIKGECPCCGAKDQYGDSCEACGSTYSNTNLKNAYSTVSGSTPIKKKTKHLFFELDHYREQLKKWIENPECLQKPVANKLMEWFGEGLHAWDITRDKPYFGILIPGYTDKYFYVWLDAPLGYMAIFRKLCKQNTALDFDHYWKQDSSTELHHFIGKDVMYFHALFWPAILMSAGLRTPSSIKVHGFLTINGKKMSKSRGTFITVRDYLDHFSAEAIRYYFAAKLGTQVEDIDLDAKDFIERINSDLVGKFINIGSRCARFINRDFNNKLADTLDNTALWESLQNTADKVSQHYQLCQYSQAVRCIMQYADEVNQYIDQKQPWKLAKANPQDHMVQLICSQGIQCFRGLAILLAPIIPQTAAACSRFLNSPINDWQQIKNPLLGHNIEKFEPLMTRLDLKQAEKLFANEG